MSDALIKKLTDYNNPNCAIKGLNPYDSKVNRLVRLSDEHKNNLNKFKDFMNKPKKVDVYTVNFEMADHINKDLYCVGYYDLTDTKIFKRIKQDIDKQHNLKDFSLSVNKYKVNMVALNVDFVIINLFERLKYLKVEIKKCDVAIQTIIYNKSKKSKSCKLALNARKLIMNDYLDTRKAINVLFKNNKDLKDYYMYLVNLGFNVTNIHNTYRVINKGSLFLYN